MFDEFVCLPFPTKLTGIFTLCDAFHSRCLSLFSSVTPTFLLFLSFTGSSCSSLTRLLFQIFFVISSRCLPLPLRLYSLFAFAYSLTGPSSLAGTEKGLELTPVVAISVHLLASDGAELQVTEPVTVSVPLPADCGLKENDHIPAWRFDPRLGVYSQTQVLCNVCELER